MVSSCRLKLITWENNILLPEINAVVLFQQIFSFFGNRNLKFNQIQPLKEAEDTRGTANKNLFHQLSIMI